MNMVRIAIAAALALALAACSSGSGGKNQLQSDLDAANAALMEARQALATAQAAQAAAEAAQAAAEAAQATAEADAAAAQMAQAAAEADTAAAQAAQATAEAAQAAAQMAQADAETAQAAAEAARDQANVALGVAQQARAAAEQARDTAMSAQMQAEADAAEADAARMAAEAAKAEADAARAAAEADTATAQAAQAAAEADTAAAQAAQAGAEAAQAAAESAQAAAEAAQATAEAAQAAAEAAQAEAEQLQMAAEAARDAARTELGQTQVRLETAIMERDAARQSLDETSRNLTSVQSQLDTLLAAGRTEDTELIANLQQQVTDLNEEVAMKQSDLNEANGMLEARKAEIMAAMDALTAAGATADTLAAQITIFTAAKTAAEDARNAAQTAAEEARKAQGVAETALQTAQDKVTELMTRIDGDGTDANPGLVMELATAKSELATANANITAAMTALTTAEATGETLAAQIASMTTLIAGLREEIKVLEQKEADSSNTVASRMAEKAYALIKDSTPADAATRAGLTVVRVGDEATFKYGDYEKVDDMAMPISGWLTGTMTDADMTGMFYSNIDAPGAELFVKKYGGTGVNATVPMGRTGDATLADTPWTSAKIAKDATYTISTVNNANQTRVTGTYDSAPGTFVCTSGACDRIVFAADGTATVGAGNTWTFEPANGYNAMVPVPDKDYLAFGFWLTKDADDNPTGFGTVYNSNAGLLGTAGGGAADITAVTGRAIYEGAAAGKYARRDLGRGTSAGYFTAGVRLTADFGEATSNTASDGTGTGVGTLYGSVSDFMSGSESPFGNMSIQLKRSELSATGGLAASLTDSTNEDLSDHGMAKAKFGTLETGDGAWEFQLGGNDTDDKNQPTGVVGAFDAEWGVGTVAGAFGATKQ